MWVLKHPQSQLTRQGQTEFCEMKARTELVQQWQNLLSRPRVEFRNIRHETSECLQRCAIKGIYVIALLKSTFNDIFDAKRSLRQLPVVHTGSDLIRLPSVDPKML